MARSEPLLPRPPQRVRSGGALDSNTDDQRACTSFRRSPVGWCSRRTAFATCVVQRSRPLVARTVEAGVAWKHKMTRLPNQRIFRPSLCKRRRLSLFPTVSAEMRPVIGPPGGGSLVTDDSARRRDSHAVAVSCTLRAGTTKRTRRTEISAAWWSVTTGVEGMGNGGADGDEVQGACM